MASGVLAVAVALVVVAAGQPPTVWAENAVRVTIPKLPPAELKIPSLQATIKAEAKRVPGKAVIVTVRAECPPEQVGAIVPMVVQVFRSDPKSQFGRRIVLPKEVTSATCSLLIDRQGKAKATVELPMMWTSDKTVTAKELKSTGGYYLVLTSPLVPAKASPLTRVRVVPAVRQVGR